MATAWLLEAQLNSASAAAEVCKEMIHILSNL